MKKRFSEEQVIKAIKHGLHLVVCHQHIQLQGIIAEEVISSVDLSVNKVEIRDTRTTVTRHFCARFDDR